MALADKCERDTAWTSRRPFLKGAAALMALTAAWAASPALAQEELRNWAIFRFIGSASTFGKQNYQGVDIAADLINDRGGINGRKVVLLKGDANNTRTAASEVNRLISVEGANIFFGSSVSSVAMVASQEAERNGAFYWEGMGVANDITNRWFQNLFRFGMNASGLGLPAARHTVDVLPDRLSISIDGMKIAILAEDSGFGTDVSAAAAAYVTEHGASVVMHESYPSKITDLLSAILNRLLKKSAARNGFLSAQPAAFGFGTFGADGIRA